MRLPVALQVNAAASGAKVAGNLGLKGTLTLNTMRFAGLDTQASLQTPALFGLPMLGNGCRD